MSVLPDCFAPAHVRVAPGAASLEYEIVRNSLGEAWMQGVHPQVSATDAALTARGIDPFGAVTFIGEAQGLSEAGKYDRALFLRAAADAEAEAWDSYLREQLGRGR